MNHTHKRYLVCLNSLDELFRFHHKQRHPHAYVQVPQSANHLIQYHPVPL